MRYSLLNFNRICFHRSKYSYHEHVLIAPNLIFFIYDCSYLQILLLSIQCCSYASTKIVPIPWNYLLCEVITTFIHNQIYIYVNMKAYPGFLFQRNCIEFALNAKPVRRYIPKVRGHLSGDIQYS